MILFVDPGEGSFYYLVLDLRALALSSLLTTAHLSLSHTLTCLLCHAQIYSFPLAFLLTLINTQSVTVF